MAKLHFYYSAMNAGKTTTLLQSEYNYRERGMDTLLYKPSFDDRESASHIQSRIGLKAKAILFDKNFNFLQDIQNKKSENPKIQCVLIDEAQFLYKEQVHQLCRVVDTVNIPVLAYGLRTDFQGEPFEGSQYLLAWAEELNEIKTICHCGSRATMNLRVDQNGNAIITGEQVEIGGNERYVAMCRKHYYQALQPKALAA